MSAKLRVLVACEYSGRVRDAFIAKGHYAMSCDLLPTESPGPHYQGDVRDILNDGWDMMVAFPDCTYLTCSAEWAYKDGPYHQNIAPCTLVGDDRRKARDSALDFVRLLLEAPILRICIENPRGVIGTRIRPATQWIQPYDYGEDASKVTGLWLSRLGPLAPTARINGRWVEWPKGSGKMVERWGNQTDSGQNNLSPGPDRWKERARTYPGIARAMADQWG